jgi:hypothetical protein
MYVKLLLSAQWLITRNLTELQDMAVTECVTFAIKSSGEKILVYDWLISIWSTLA